MGSVHSLFGGHLCPALLGNVRLLAKLSGRAAACDQWIKLLGSANPESSEDRALQMQHGDSGW